MVGRRAFVSGLVGLLAAVACLAMSSRATSAEPIRPGAIHGIVVNADGRRIPQAMVELRHGDHVLRKQLTTRDGEFHFGDLRPGEYGVFAGKPEVGRGAERVKVEPAKVTKVKVTLKK